MRTTALIAVLCLAVPVARAEDALSSRRGYTTTTIPGDRLDLRFIRWGDAILLENVMVNGKGPYRFMLDTGAEGAGRVDSALVNTLNLPQVGESTSAGVLGQSHAMTERHLDSLSIGDLKFTGVTMGSRDYSREMPRGMRPIDGIIGYHLFNEYLLTIDYPSRTITVMRGELPPPDGKSILPIVSDDEDPEIEVTVAGRKTVALLDTGGMVTLAVPAAFAKELKFASAPTVIGTDDGVEIQSATLDGALQIGAIEIANPRTIIAGPLSQTNIGIKILSSLAMTFDQKNARVRVERAVPRKRYGLNFSKRGSNPWEFKGVDAGSIAETAGIRSTDSLIAIDGRHFAEIDQEELNKLLDASTVMLLIERDGARQEIQVSLE